MAAENKVVLSSSQPLQGAVAATTDVITRRRAGDFSSMVSKLPQQTKCKSMAQRQISLAENIGHTSKGIGYLDNV